MVRPLMFRLRYPSHEVCNCSLHFDGISMTVFHLHNFFSADVASNLSNGGPSWQIQITQLSIWFRIDERTGVFTRFISENNLSTNAYDTGRVKRRHTISKGISQFLLKKHVSYT